MQPDTAYQNFTRAIDAMSARLRELERRFDAWPPERMAEAQARFDKLVRLVDEHDDKFRVMEATDTLKERTTREARTTRRYVTGLLLASLIPDALALYALVYK